MYEARPTVKAGSRMCHAMTQANCRRDRNSGSESMLSPRFPSRSACHAFTDGSRSRRAPALLAADAPRVPLPGTCISSLSIGVADRKPAPDASHDHAAT